MEKKTQISKPVEIKNRQDFQALIKRIDKSDPAPEDVRALRKELNDKPELYRRIGNLQECVFSNLLKRVVSSNFGRECAERYIEELKTELGYQDSTFVERMLIDEIVMRWLRLQSTESLQMNAASQSHSVDVGTYHEKQLDLAQKRFLRAIDTLVKVRKMIAQTQVKGAEMFKNLMKNN